MCINSNDSGRDDDEGQKRVWNNVPNVEVLVRGLKFTWPGQRTPAHSENMAACRFFFETEIAGRPADTIPLKDFHEAYAICQKSVSVPEVDTDTNSGRPRTQPRYTFNGMIKSTDDPDEIRRQMDICWQGYAVEQDGLLYFRPGAVRRPVGEITEDIVFKLGVFNPQPSLQERFNAATVSIRQDRYGNYEPADLPLFPDQQVIDGRDYGQVLERDLGQWPFVSDVGRAHRLRGIMMRRMRNLSTFQVTVFPGENDERVGWIPTDRVYLTLPRLRINRVKYSIVTRKMEQDRNITFLLEEQPDSVFSEASVLPPITVRPVAPPIPDYLPTKPQGLSAAIRYDIADDGTRTNLLAVSWDRAPHICNVRVSGPDGFTGQQSASIPPVTIPIQKQGRYRIEAAFESRTGRESIESVLNYDARFVTGPVNYPFLLNTETHPPSMTFIFQHVSDADLESVEFRYQFQELGVDTAWPEYDDSDWDDLTLLAIVPISSNPLLARPITATAAFPRTGQYNLYARFTSRSGTQSRTSHLGPFQILIPQKDADTRNYQPLWTGTLTNVGIWGADRSLVFDPPASAEGDIEMPLTQWNGQQGWPFGPPGTNQAQFQTHPVTVAADFENAKTIEVRLTAGFITPPRPAGQGIDPSKSVILRIDAGQGDGNFPVNMDNMTNGAWTRLTSGGGQLYACKQIRARLTLPPAFQGAGINQFRMDYRRVSS